MDPRVKAIEDTANGIPNDDQWNDAQPMSATDKRRDFYAQIWFFIVQMVFSALVFRNMELQYSIVFTLLACANLHKFFKYLIFGTK
jgi:hypothetical protein